MKIENKIEWTRKDMPVLESIKKKLEFPAPFRDLTIGACLHLTKETAMLLLAIQNSGAKVIACASNPLSTQDDVVEHLRASGIIVHGKRGMSTEEYNSGLMEVIKAKPDYIIDDGADLTEAIHTAMNAELSPLGDYIPKGGLEQTTTGVTRIKNMELKYPILAVNDADTKHLFDNVYGTGQSTIDGIVRATNMLLAGKNFVVVGYGNCGKGLAQRARGMGCNVSVAEIDPIKALQAVMDGFKVGRLWELVFDADVIVTVTGSINVLDKQIPHLKNGVVIANSGHFDVEINKTYLKENSEKVREISEHITEYLLYGVSKVNLLSEGRLVNLAAAEGHPSEVMDMSFANQILGLQYIVENKLKPGVHKIPREIDEKVASLKLDALDITIDEETEEQIIYRNS